MLASSLIRHPLPNKRVCGSILGRGCLRVSVPEALSIVCLSCSTKGLCYWDTVPVVELHIFIPQLSELNWLQYNWRIFLPTSQFPDFLTRPLGGFNNNILRGLLLIRIKLWSPCSPQCKFVKFRHNMQIFSLVNPERDRPSKIGSSREWSQWTGLSKDMPHYRFFWFLNFDLEFLKKVKIL
jgi:hypothetical protein